MKSFKAFLIIQLILSNSICFSQNIKMNKEIEEIIQQGKDSIVQMALKLIDNEVTADYFTEIIVRSSSKEVYVSFLTPIKYLPINSAYNFDIEVSLLEKGTTYHNYSNPKGYNEDKMDLPFYKETDDGKKNIQFVIEAIKEWAPFDVSKFDDNMIIRDNTDYYDINVLSDYQESWYKISKSTGEIFDEGHAHFVQPPTLEADNQEIFVEIK